MQVQCSQKGTTPSRGSIVPVCTFLTPQVLQLNVQFALIVSRVARAVVDSGGILVIVIGNAAAFLHRCPPPLWAVFKTIQNNRIQRQSSRYRKTAPKLTLMNYWWGASGNYTAIPMSVSPTKQTRRRSWRRSRSAHLPLQAWIKVWCAYWDAVCAEASARGRSLHCPLVNGLESWICSLTR